MSFWRNWGYLYQNPPAAECRFERVICLLGEPYRTQYPFPGLRRIADFVLLDSRVVIEIDGVSHSRPAQIYKDLVSSVALEKRGWRVIRFTNEETLRLEAAHIREIIQERITHRPTLPELEAALAQLPVPPVRASKPRVRKQAPVPKKARKRQA